MYTNQSLTKLAYIDNQNLTLTILSFSNTYSGFNDMWTLNFQMFELNVEKAEEPETRDQITNICWIIEKKNRELQKNIYFCFIDYV